MHVLMLSFAFLAAPPGSFSVEPGFTVERADPATSIPHAYQPTKQASTVVPAVVPKREEPIPAPTPTAGISKHEHGIPSGLALDFKPGPARDLPDRLPDPYDPTHVPRQWYPLGGAYAGYFGYGRTDAAGNVLVEWHCQAGTTQVRRGPILLPARVTTYAAPVYAPAAVCGPGGCPQQFAPAYTMRQGFWRGLFGR